MAKNKSESSSAGNQTQEGSQGGIQGDDAFTSAGFRGSNVEPAENGSGSCRQGEAEMHRPTGNDDGSTESYAAVGQYTETEPLLAGVAATKALENAPQSVSPPLDAWYGSFASSLTRALAMRDDLVGLRESIIGRDDRVRVGDTSQYPYRAICSLSITAANGNKWIGTGWLAGPRLIVTAGHCVYIHEDGGWVRSIEVIPGRNGSSRPYGSRICTRFRSVSGWTQQENSDFDYGVILQTEGDALGDQAGYFGFGVRSDSALGGSTVTVSGYPGDKPAGTQWAHAERVNSVSNRRIFYTSDTAGGQSGGPVYVIEGQSRVAVGVHTNGGVAANSGSRINDEVFRNLKDWKAESER